MDLRVNNNTANPYFKGTFQIKGEYTKNLYQTVSEIASGNNMGKIKPGVFDSDKLFIYGTGENDVKVAEELNKAGIKFLYTDKLALKAREVKDAFEKIAV